MDSSYYEEPGRSDDEGSSEADGSTTDAVAASVFLAAGFAAREDEDLEGRSELEAKEERAA